MAESEQFYRRLPGMGRNLTNFTRLWLGRDHLLAVYSTGYSENYKRFYYRDIQAIITRTTIRGKIWNVVFAVPAALLAAGGILDPAFGRISTWTWAGILLLGLSVNWLRGPTCVCHLRTAVQLERLTSLNRLRTARKVITKIRSMVDETQGILPPPGLSDRIELPATTPEASKESVVPPPPTISSN
jgi:hypothetical protein